MAGIRIKWLSDIADAVRGNKAVKDSLEDVVDALQDVDSGAKGLGNVRGVEKLESGLDDVEAQARRTESAVNDIGDSGTTSFRKLGDKGAEVSSELKQNLGETFSSFRGDLEDLPQIAQDTLGGLAGSGAIGGIPGLIATAAGAAGLGLLIGAFQSAGEESDKVKEKAAALAQSYIEASGTAAPAIEDIVSALQKLATQTDDAETSLSDLRDVADLSGNNFKDLAQAYAGNTDQLDELLSKSEKYLANLEDQAQSFDFTKQGAEDNYGALMELLDAQGKHNEYLVDAKNAADEAAEAEANYVAAGGPEMEIKAELLDSVAQAYDGVRDAAINAATSEDGVFNVDAWAQYVEDTKGQVLAYQENLSLLKLTPEQWSNLMEMPEEARSAVVESLARGPEEAKGRIEAALTDAGSTAAASAQVSFEEGFNPKTDTKVTVDTTEAEEALNRLTRTERVATVRVRLDTSAWTDWVPPSKRAYVYVTRVDPGYEP